MFFNAKKFHYLPLSSSQASNKSNIYINPSMDITPQSTDVPDLGIIMSKDCSLILTFPVYPENAITWLAGYLDHSSLVIDLPC